jgi:sodium-dependent dicarboxylate transporter 2/3/5
MEEAPYMEKSSFNVLRNLRSSLRVSTLQIRKAGLPGLGLLFLIAGMILEPPSGLTCEGMRVLCITVFAVLMWASEIVAPAVTALAVLALIPIMQVIPYSLAFEALGSQLIWKVLGILIITQAIQETGLDRRIAYRALKISGSSPKQLLFITTVASSIMVFVLPSSFGRAALFSSMMAGLLKAVGIEPGDNLGKAILLSVVFTSLITSATVVVGASSMLYSVGVFEKFTGIRLSYLSWLKTCAPITLTSCLLVYPVIIRLFPLSSTHHAQGFSEAIHRQLEEIGPCSRSEWVVIGLLVLLGVCWTTELASVYPVEMAVAVVLLMPFAKILDWNRVMRKLGWGIILLLGASLSLSSALRDTGAAAWVVGRVISDSIIVNPVFVGFLVIITTAALRLGMANMVGASSALLPVVLPMAEALAINPLWLGLICALASTMGFLLPTQGVTQAAVYSLGYYTSGDMMRTGLWVGLVFTVVILVGAMLYWPLIGIPPVF